jgi:hypothetical protein
MDWLVEGPDYVVWRRLAEAAGDAAMVTRLDAMHAAKQSGCKTRVKLGSGLVTDAPLVLLAEAAVAANEGKRQLAWKENWVRGLVELAAERGDPDTTDGVVAILTAMDAIITEMKIARVWPWLPARKREAREEVEPDEIAEVEREEEAER